MVACNAQSCDVQCNGNDSCNTDGGIRLDAGTTGTLFCNGNHACQFASCTAVTKCQMRCDPPNGNNYACPDPASRPCSPTNVCADWSNPLGPPP